METNIGRNRNTHDVAIIKPAIPLNQTTSTKILDANPDRLFVSINNNDENFGVWIKLQAASVDDVKKGIFIPKKSSGSIIWEMPTDNVYTGEMSAIADGDSPHIYVTEF